MTKLKIDVQLDASCLLTVTDISGFYDSVANVNGFLPESSTDPVVAGSYKISNGYFIDLIIYNKYNVAPSLINVNEPFYKVTSVDPVYANNFVPSTYSMLTDGTYTVTRVFMISDVFYNANRTSGIFNGKTIYYTDGANIYLVASDSTSTVITLPVFAVTNLVNSTTLSVSSTFISVCQLNNCYFTIMDKLIDLGLNNCDVTNTLYKDRDFLYMALETIGYMQDFNNNSEIQKLIESVTNCGICNDKSKITSCGCG